MSKSSIITDEDQAMAITRTQSLAGPAPHPGEVLKDELDARGLSAHALSIALRLPASRISQIIRGERAITPETALRLARYFGGSAAIWLRLQVAYDLSRAETELASKIAAEVTPAAA
jgi:antitoxin HigA-1